jgi:hypothetical protein
VAVATEVMTGPKHLLAITKVLCYATGLMSLGNRGNPNVVETVHSILESTLRSLLDGTHLRSCFQLPDRREVSSVIF